MLRREGDLDPEGAAASGLAGDADAAVHPLDDLLGDGQPEAGAAVVPARSSPRPARTAGTGGARPVRRHADARVRDLDAHGRGVRPGRDRGDAARRRCRGGELDRVAQQVDDDLAQPRRVAAEAAVEAGLDDRREVDAGGRGLDREQLHGVLDDEPQVEIERLERDALRLDPGEVEDVVDDAEQGVGGGADGVAVLALLAVERRLRHQLRHADDAVHRRPESRGSSRRGRRPSGGPRARRDRGPRELGGARGRPAARGWPASRRPARRCRRPVVPAGW